MTDQAQAYRLFSRALELEGQQRAQFLDDQCGGDPELRRELEGLLSVATSEGPGTMALQGVHAIETESLVGRQVGHFRLVECIGAGGMGVVYRAERTDGVEQSVAIKLVSSVLDDAARSRFEREAQVLARLEHPAIARLIDAGIADERAWFAMEFVRGERIDAYCRRLGLAPRAIVALLIQVASAVAAAHGSLVVHSDIKPANVLMGVDGTPRLVDFGIATALRDLAAVPVAEAGGSRPFSPNYAAPEQVSGGAVSVATDVFGLGALAYRLLSGAALHAGATSAVAYMQAVTHRDVVPPSSAALAAGRPPAVAGQLRGDLDAIICKALARDPATRYGTATEFRADLQRYLDHRPVRARAPAVGYRLGCFMRRNTLAATLSGLLLSSVLAGGLFAGVQAQRAALAREMAARRGEFLESLLKSADPRAGRRDMTVAELLEHASGTLEQKLGSEPLVEASMLGLIADTYDGLGKYPEGLVASDRQLALLRTRGGTAREIAFALSSRGELLLASGKYEDSRPVLTESLDLLRPLRGTDDDYASVEYALGRAYANSGGEKAAEQLFRDATERYRRSNSTQRLHAGYPLTNLAVLLAHQGRYAESAQAASEALALQRQYLSSDHPDVLTPEATYAMTLMNLHRPAEAEPLLRDLLVRSQRVRGPDHPDTLVLQTQLGEVLTDLGRYEEAVGILRATAESLDRIMGRDDRYTTGAWSDYGVAACSGSDAVGGLAAAQRVAAIRARTLAADDWHQAAAQVVIGNCLVRLQRYADAEPVLSRASSDLEGSRGAAFYHTQRAYAGLRDLYQATGRASDAQRMAARIHD